MTDTGIGHAFRTWLRGCVEHDGRSSRLLGEAAGLSYRTVSDLIAGKVQRPSEQTARRLAEAFASNPDEAAALAGYGPAVEPGPRPADFGDARAWLLAALAARGVAPVTASVQAGFSPPAILQILKTDYTPERTTLDRLAAYFNVDPLELRALRPKVAARVAGGKRVAERLGVDAMRELAATGRAAITTEHHRVAGLRSAVKRRQRWATEGHPLNNGEWVRCLFCDDPDHLLYRVPSVAAKGEGKYHRECFVAWTRTLEVQKQRQVTGQLGWIWSRVKASSDEALKTRIRRQIDDYVAYIRQPKRRGRPAVLLTAKERAITTALLVDEVGMTVLQVSQLSNLRDPDKKYDPKQREASTTTWEDLRFGRVLLGTTGAGSQEKAG